MCLIVDNNVVRRVFGLEPAPDFDDLRKALFTLSDTPIRLVYESQLLREYVTYEKVRLLLLELSRLGRVRRVPDAPIQAEMQILQAEKHYTSDDPHILALARVENIRLLCSEDTALRADFLNRQIIDNGRGFLYDHPRHNHLLRIHCGVHLKAKPKQPRTPKKR